MLYYVHTLARNSISQELDAFREVDTRQNRVRGSFHMMKCWPQIQTKILTLLKLFTYIRQVNLVRHLTVKLKQKCPRNFNSNAIFKRDRTGLDGQVLNLFGQNYTGSCKMKNPSPTTDFETAPSEINAVTLPIEKSTYQRFLRFSFSALIETCRKAIIGFK